MPPKVRLFEWRMCKGILPTVARIATLMKETDVRCARYGYEVENDVHALKDCLISMTTLSFCQFPQILIKESFCCIVDWVEKAALILDKENFEKFLMMCWANWNARNGEIHQHEKLIGRIHFERTMHLLSEFKKIQEYRSSFMLATTKLSWRPPPMQLYKINFDASYDAANKVRGAGIVARDYEGYVLGCAAVKIEKVTDPNIAEAIAACNAMDFAGQMGFTRIILEGDSALVLNSLNTRDGEFSCIGPIIEEGREKTESFKECVVQHSRRQANEAAHCLARFCLTCNENMYWLGGYLAFIHQTIMSDAINL